SAGQVVSVFFFSSRRRHTRCLSDWSSDVCSSDLRVVERGHMHCYRAEEMAYVLGVAHEFGFHVTAFHHAVEAYKISDLLAREGEIGRASCRERVQREGGAVVVYRRTSSMRGQGNC